MSFVADLDRSFGFESPLPIWKQCRKTSEQMIGIFGVPLVRRTIVTDPSVFIDISPTSLVRVSLCYVPLTIALVVWSYAIH